MTTDTTIEVDAPDAEALFRKWIDRGDAVGVFRNHDLSSRDVGRAVFMPLQPDEQLASNVGKMHARDGAHGLGWRYLLDEWVSDIGRFKFASPPERASFCSMCPSVSVKDAVYCPDCGASHCRHIARSAPRSCVKCGRSLVAVKSGRKP